MVAGSFQDDNALTIKPFRLNAYWEENTGNGLYGQGVSYRFRVINEAYEWTGGSEGGWWDKIDDVNGTNKINKTGGTPPDAIPLQNWVSFDVTSSVSQWKNGATNYGFLLVATNFEGGGTAAEGAFTSRNDSGAAYRPKLAVTYEPPVPAPRSTWGRIKGLYRCVPRLPGPPPDQVPSGGPSRAFPGLRGREGWDRARGIPWRGEGLHPPGHAAFSLV